MVDFIKKNYFEGIRRFFLSEKIIYFIIAIGIILYLRQYLNDRCLWHDEAKISLDIIRLPVSSFLHQPLPYHNQAAPLGFLIIERLLVSIMGTGEYALRLYPFIAGVISLWLFYRMILIYLKAEFVALGLLIFVITPSLVYYASEVKPYYSDVFFVLISYVVIAEFCLKELDWNKTWMVGALGALIIWFSFPVIFVLGGIGTAIFLATMFQGNHRKLWKVSIFIFCWLTSFVFYYAVILHNIVQVKSSEEFWQSGYISFTDIRIWLDVFIDILRYPVGSGSYLLLAPIVFFIGLYSFFKESKDKFSILSFPLFFVFIASGLHRYSCKDRLALFILPIILIIILKGIEKISVTFGKLRIITVILLIGILFYGSSVATYREFINPEEKENIKSIMYYVKENIKRGDVICVYPGTADAFNYYYSVRGFSFGSNAKEKWPIIVPWKLEDNLKKMYGLKRVWILFTNNWHYWKKNSSGAKDKEYFFHYFSESGGKMLDHFSCGNGEVYLFDLSKFSSIKNNNIKVSLGINKKS